MNGDATLVEAELNSGPRVKRLKIDKTRDGNNTLSRYPFTLSRPNSVGGRRSAGPNGVKLRQTILKDGGSKPMSTTPTIQVRQTRNISTRSATSTPTKKSLPLLNSQRRSLPSSRLSPRADSPKSAETLAISEAPADPVEFVWWIAQQITHLGSTSSTQPDEHSSQPSSSQTAKSLKSSSSYALRPHKPSEKVRLSGQNQERKRQQRENYTECKSDIELRSRITKLAAIKFGAEDTPGKSSFIKSEFSRQRTLREVKQRTRATKAGEFPSFPITPGLTSDLFAGNKRGTAREVQVAGNLLTDALFVTVQSSASYTRLTAANTIKSAIKDGTIKNESLAEALRMIAQDSVLAQSINLGLGLDSASTAIGVGAADEEGEETPKSTESSPSFVELLSTITVEQSTEMIKALNAALALMIDMADTKVYASPYGNPTPSSAGPVQPSTSLGEQTVQTNDSMTKIDELDIGGFQLDAFLRLANGGSLTDDDDDDKTIADPDEMLDEERLDNPDDKGTDTIVMKTIEAVIDQLVTDRGESLGASDQHNSHASLSLGPYGPQSAREQASKLRGLLSEAGIRVNMIMPVAQGHAMSQFYAHLISRTNPNKPSGVEKLASINIVPSPHSMLPVPLPLQPSLGPVFNNFGHPPPQPPPQDFRLMPKTPAFPPQYSINTLPRATTKPLSTSKAQPIIRTGLKYPGSRSEEEQQKIRSYGFPPAPGSIVGIDRIE